MRMMTISPSPFLCILAFLIGAFPVHASAQVISAGYYDHFHVLCSNGTVWGWGDNTNYQLGDGTTDDHYDTVVQASGLSNVRGISSGEDYTIAVKSDGTVWAWGGAVSYTSPTQVSSLSDIIAVSARTSGFIALQSGGTVLTIPFSSSTIGTPAAVSGLSNVIAIAAGGGHNLALKSDGTVWAWGSNSAGQLGDGTTTNQPTTPVQVSSLTGITGIAAGEAHSLAIKSDGTVWAWGRNNFGQLGDGSNTNSSTAIQISSFSGVTAIAAGDNHSLAAKSDGTAWAWGRNNNGELGDSSYTHRNAPVQISGITGITALAGGRFQSMAAKFDGTVYRWGNDVGTLNMTPNVPMSMSSYGLCLPGSTCQ